MPVSVVVAAVVDVEPVGLVDVAAVLVRTPWAGSGLNHYQIYQRDLIGMKRKEKQCEMMDKSQTYWAVFSY